MLAMLQLTCVNKRVAFYDNKGENYYLNQFIMYCIACTTKFTDDLISIYVVSTNGLTARMFKCFRLCTGNASFFNIQYAHNLRDHLTVMKHPSICRRKRMPLIKSSRSKHVE